MEKTKIQHSQSLLVQEGFNYKLAEYKELKSRSFILTLLIFFTICYFFSSASLFIANTQSLESIDSYFHPFHNLDFIGSFIFAVVECISLISAEIIVFGEPRFFMVFINVGLTLIAAILFLIKAEYWEVTSHWIEFSAQVFLTSIDLVFISNQFKDKENVLYKFRYYEVGLILILLLSSVVKLFIYGGVIDFHMDGEQLAHYLEFIGEMINSSFALLFLFTIYNELQTKIKLLISEMKERTTVYI